MTGVGPSNLAEGILNRRLPAWRKATLAPTRWTVSLRSRTLLTRQSKYGLYGYRSYRAYRLRSDYSEIEMDLRSVYEHFAHMPWFDHQRAAQVVSILDSSLDGLELSDPNLDVVNDDLGRARRLMVWVSPPEWIEGLSDEIQGRLRRSGAPEAKGFKLDGTDPDARRFRLDEAIGILDEVKTVRAINNGLQVRRLELIRNVGYAAVLLLILFAPVLVSSSSLTFWNLSELRLGPLFAPWLTTVGVGLVGAIGALLSGLLQVRSSPVTYTDYEVRGIEIALRILVGTAISVTLYYLLSWQVVSVVNVTSAGTFLFVAFVSGFSERYFLRLLGIDSVEQAEAHEHLEADDADASDAADTTSSKSPAKAAAPK